MSNALKKLPKPPSDLSKYEKEDYAKNPLLKFRVSNLRKQRHYEFLKRKANEEKRRLSRTLDTQPVLSPSPPIDPNYYISKLHEAANQMPIPRMPQRIEKRIKEAVPNSLRQKYPDLVKEYMNEVREDHDKILKSHCINRILVPICDSDESVPEKIEFKFKYAGRTENFSVFLENQNKLKKEFYLTYPFVRAVLHYSELDFPEVLNNYGSYNNKDRQKIPLTLSKFSQLAEKDLYSNSHFIKHVWYPKIIAVIRKHYKRRALTLHQWSRAFRCIKGLINRQINNVKIRTLNQLVEVVLDRDRIPVFKLSVVCYETINLEPSFYSIVKCYTNIFRDIAKIATTLEAIELQIDRVAFPSSLDRLPVSINETYFEEALQRLKDSLEIAYGPVLDYLEEFQDKYYELYCSKTKEDLELFLKQSHTFDEYFSRIKLFNDFIDMLRAEMQKEYFDIVILDKSMAICELKRIAKALIRMVTEKIVAEHMQDQRDICRSFEEIQEKALRIPKTTEELLASGEYMAQVKTKLIAALHERIQLSLKFGADLFELTELSQEHIKLQRTTINWLENINVIFEKNAALQESYKVLFEEHLQNVAKKLNDDVLEMVPAVNSINDMSDTEKFRDYSILLENFMDQLKAFDDYVEWINKEEKLFKFPKSQYPTLDALKDFVIPFAELMKLCIQSLRNYYVWMDGPFEYLKPSFVQKTTDHFYSEFVKTQKYYLNRIKQDLMGNPICKFRGQTEDPDPEKHPVPLRLCGKMVQWINEFRTGVFIVNIMCNPALCPRHWEEMSELVGFHITPHAGTTLRKIMDFNIYDKLPSLEVISIGANKELQLQGNLQGMVADWKEIMFRTEIHKDSQMEILASLDDVQTMLDDQIIKTLSMRGSAFVKPSEKVVRSWYEKLLRINSTFEEWQKLQYSYLYLLPIFSSVDIVTQMQPENELFKKIEHIYQTYMETIMNNPNIIEIAPSEGFLEDLQEANRLLDEIMNGVNVYLEKKRVRLPRFFFLSNDELLSILSETRNPLRIQSQLKKCFEGIEYLDFDKDLNVLAMNSAQQEKIKFRSKVSTRAAGGNVEKWLIRVEREMLTALRYEAQEAFNTYEKSIRTQWIFEHPQMMVLSVSQIYFVAKVHGFIDSGNFQELATYRDAINQELYTIVRVARSAETSNLNKITASAFVILDIHICEIADALIENQVQTSNDFHWLAQLRYYWQDDEILVRILNATIEYGYEYLGNTDRLIITPLTDRCYQTLIGAYQLNLNAAPEGPAGTGKTETMKDLTKALAMLCKIFNCSESMDYVSLGKFFKGLSACGAWVCFDEFNRINLEVLSVVGQQIQCIAQAIRANLPSIFFEGTEIKVDPRAFICITLNPGYVGRSDLPDNLKVLFRPVSMVSPDYLLIAETTLYSYGFEKYKELSRKIITAYRLFSERLSLQNHYDYGMRAIKAMLVSCGYSKDRFPDKDEDTLIIEVLKAVNLPKFLYEDVPLFENIITDLFPDVVLDDTNNSVIRQHAQKVCNDMKLKASESFQQKLLQTYQTMQTRHGLMVVGEAKTGKSTTLVVLSKIWEKLKESEGITGQTVQLAVVNPKAITMDQLYGIFDRAIYEWKDGVVPIIFRKFATSIDGNMKWLVFDGPIDAYWIENMNTVLDDNKKLCLNSGEVIAMSSLMSIVFETINLAQASPATVSRCGMIYFESRTLGWETYVESWLEKCDDRWATEGKKLIPKLLEWIISPVLKNPLKCNALYSLFFQTLRFLRKSCHQFLIVDEFGLISTTLDIFEMLLQEAVEENLDDYSRYLSAWFQAALIYSMNWGVGGNLDSESREKFDVFQRTLWNGSLVGTPIPESIGRVEVSMPSEGLVVDYTYLFKQKGTWKYWPDLVKRLEPEESALGMQVATIDTGRYMHLLELHVKYKKKVLFVGPTGTGKSFYMKHMLMTKLSAEKYTPAFMSLTVKMTARQTQETLISKLVKHRKGNYGPQKDRLAIIFIDDMNMPEKDASGAQPPLELLRQFFDYGYWYDLSDKGRLAINNVLIFSACGIPGGSRQNVSTRLLSHFNIFSINHFSDETVNKIFATILFTSYKKIGYGNDVLSHVNQIVCGTQEIYKNVCQGLKPTPTKSHYIFNIRDISRVCIGCSLLRKESVDNKRIFARLWYHECMRVFHDRLVNEVDQFWIFNKMNEVIVDQFHEQIAGVFENYCDEGSQLTLYNANRLMFRSYNEDGVNCEDRRYEEIASLEKFNQTIYKKLEEYNSKRKNNKMQIVLFNYALQHLNKICRIITIQGESGLLVGMAGTGRQSLTKLAAAICHETLYEPKTKKGYDLNDWHTDLKEALKEAGGEGKDTVFLVNGSQIKMERFLQDIDCILNQGEVPNIYAIDERQEILEMVRLDAQGGNRNADITPLEVFSYFVNRCKQRLHIILCFSPIGSSLRKRFRLYPSLVNCCTIDWFQPWPEEALHVVAQHFIEQINLNSTTKEACVAASRHIHLTAISIVDEFCKETGRYVYTTPTSFLELLRLFQVLVNKKQKEIITMKRRYMAGLETLQKATIAVAAMQKELSALQPKLQNMAENSKKMMVEINKETIAAEVAAEQVKKDELVANMQATAAQGLKDECEKDLAQAIPVLEDAIQALNTLKPTDITLVKSMKNPPSAIKLVMAAVCVIKGVSADRINDPTTGKKTNDYWGPSKRILGDMGFLQSLKDFDKDNINPDIMKRIRKDFIPHKDFQPHIVLKASSAAEGLCKWIIAMDLYDAVAKIVAPKKTRLQIAEKEYADTMKILNEKREMAEALEKKVRRLNEEHENANAEMRRTSDEVEYCKARLLRAETLIGSLGGEKSRWSEAAENLQAQYDNIPGDILLSSASIAYVSALSAPYREKCVQDWFTKCTSLKIPRTEGYSIVTILGSEMEIQNWNLDELPRDGFSVENAVIMSNSIRCNLFVDPQGQANRWIKNMERLNRLQVVKLTQINYIKIVENSIAVGRPVLIENILEDLDVSLEPILKPQTFQRNGSQYISLNGSIVKLSPKFKLYLTSNLRNPHYLPELFNKVTIINFSLTPQGLEDQLLGIVVAKERPELQELRQSLITQKTINKTLLKNTEDKILETLSSSKTDIVENEESIRILDESKELAADIERKQEDSRETEMRIENFWLSYKPVAVHSAVLYYTTTDLPNIDTMYQFSLNWFTTLYIRSIENANKSKDLMRRRKYLMDAITLNLYTTVCRAISERHRLLFSFILTTKIMLSTGQMTEHQLEFLLSNGNGGNCSGKPDESWITETVWYRINRLEKIPELNGFVASFKSNLESWKHLYESVEPQEQTLPVLWEKKVTRFEKILILAALRPDKLHLAITNFISIELGPQYVTIPEFDLLKPYEDSNCMAPLIFILSSGADPMASLLLFAKKMGFDETFETISLGQGQGPAAEQLIAKAQVQGSWICLQNCHLATSWMPKLQRIWESMDVFNTASTFRLWLTCYPCISFPDTLLQNGVKIANELPTGLRQSLIRSYNTEPMNDEKFYTGCPEKDRSFTRLLYGMCFFYAVVQERQKFGSLGWNIPYGFNDSDFHASAQQLQMYLNEYKNIPYDTIYYLTAECNYGGRVSDEQDRHVIRTLLRKYINEDVVNDLRYQFGDDAAYILPRKSEHREMVRYINEFIPSRPDPEVYGLHRNAGIKRDLRISNELLGAMDLTRKIASVGYAAESEQFLLEKINDILEKLPSEEFDIDDAKGKYSLSYDEVMNTVLVQEMEKYRYLLRLIRSTCSELVGAIQGLTIMTPDLDEVADMISAGKLPIIWRKHSYENMKPLGSFVQDFVVRYKWIAQWYRNGKPNTFWIPGFFFPQGFLTGIIQDHARKRKLSIDKLKFNFKVENIESMDSQPATGAYINGFYIEGARWDTTRNSLAEQIPRILIEAMPCIHFIPTTVENDQKNNRYKCPAYKTAERRGAMTTTGHTTNFIISVLLDSNKPNEHWIKRSTALICQTDD